MTPHIISMEQRAALVRLVKVAQGEAEQSRRVANFLLAWQNAAEYGGWNPTEILAVTRQAAQDLLTALVVIRISRAYLPQLGFEEELAAILKRWRGGVA